MEPTTPTDQTDGRRELKFCSVSPWPILFGVTDQIFDIWPHSLGVPLDVKKWSKIFF